MKTIVITGSARGLGFAMAEDFRKADCNVVLSDLKEGNLREAKEKLEKISSKGKIITVVCNVSKYEDLENLMQETLNNFKKIDVWINNAGVNQPQEPIYKCEKSAIDTVIDVDLKGAIYGSKIAMSQMIKQKEGAIYNIEGYGSNDAHMSGLNLYGTSKRAVTYLTEALAQEAEGTGVIVGKLAPGIMITQFTTHSLVNQDIKLSERTKKVYNILGDKPETVAKFFVDNILTNKKNGVKINWLTNGKAFYRFLTAGFNKRNFFDADGEIKQLPGK